MTESALTAVTAALVLTSTPARITRFLMNLGNALLVLYLLYYLTDAVDLTDDEAEDAVFVLTGVYGLCTVVTAYLGRRAHA